MGDYTVNIESSICVPTDYTNTACTTMTVNYDFLVVIEPCMVQSFEDTMTVATIMYALGTPTDANISPYEFTQFPDCGYLETVTLTNLPPFVTHNGGSKDFTVPSNFDLSLIGQYIVTIKSEINVPQNAEQTQFQNMFVQYNFLVIVDPCSILDYVDTPPRVIELRYNIGAPALTDGNYVFDEVPYCGYPEIVTLTNLPTFVTHNGGVSDFTIPQNSDLSIIGEYTVTLKSRISVPDDYLKSSYTNHEVFYDFKVYIEPCLVTTYAETLIVGPITYFVNDPTLIDGPYTFDENPVCNYPETVTFVNLPTWVTHNSATADFRISKTGDLSLIGEHVVTITSEILVPTDYTKTTLTPMSVTYDFSIFVEPCIVTQLITTPISTVSYTIGANGVTSQQYTFTQDPQCNYDQTYIVTGVMPFFNHQTLKRNFLVPKTLDLQLEGTYDVTVRGEISVPDDYTKSSFTTISNEYTF